MLPIVPTPPHALPAAQIPEAYTPALAWLLSQPATIPAEHRAALEALARAAGIPEAVRRRLLTLTLHVTHVQVLLQCADLITDELIGEAGREELAQVFGAAHDALTVWQGGAYRDPMSARDEPDARVPLRLTRREWTWAQDAMKGVQLRAALHLPMFQESKPVLLDAALDAVKTGLEARHG
ncbi:hypothetical protein [Deinococcus kurensis]|uniref:hypothetical protein n=1 Tax=Deinococcus kurensis TaxID=2662757 RepID=UPI0012D319E5|nr:hypothetical protein [Deinococcus kurensis]